jgi:hypothetical protein
MLAFALALGGALPPEHMHLAGIEGRTDSIVHRHSLEGPAGSPFGTSIDGHGDHARALFLSTLYDSIARFIPHTPAVVNLAATIALPARAVERIHIDDVHRAHGPPRATTPTRAPPVLA